MTRIFVYGTLKKGFHNHRLLEGQKFICKAETDDLKVMHCTGIPFLYNVGGYYYNGNMHRGHHVTGEVYDVDDQALKMIDALEGHPRWYRRQSIRLRSGHTEHYKSKPRYYDRFMAEAYFMTPDVTHNGLPEFPTNQIRRTF